jgi:vacuolar-type H+-ATPase subunit C/Vma6
MELALDKWFYEEARQTLRRETGMVDPLSFALALEADLTNVLTILRFAQYPHERNVLRDHLGTDEVVHLLIGPGHIPRELLTNAFRQDTVASAIETLSDSFFGPSLRAGLDAYARSNRLSDIERQLKHYRLAWMSSQIRKDPLGIGVVLGYMALKVNEVDNIRWITQGINLGLKTDAIRAGLETIS